MKEILKHMNLIGTAGILIILIIYYKIGNPAEWSICFIGWFLLFIQEIYLLKK